MKKVTVEDLNSKKKFRELDEIVNDEIKNIDYKIQQTHNDGHCSCAYPLSTTFSVGELQARDAIIYVYSELIKSYVSRGFTVNITIIDNRYNIVCSWVNQLAIQDMKEREKLLKKHSS